MVKHIVIVGGSYIGVGIAHRILKVKEKLEPFKITLVSRDTDLYWNMAAPRGLVPGQIATDKIFHPIAPGFAKFKKEQFEFVVASATAIDFDAKKLTVSGDGGERAIDYDYVILATGSYAKEDTPFKSVGSTEATKKVYHEFQEKVKKAKHIVVAGAGVTGCEFAGELAYNYGNEKKVVLIASGPTVLDGTPESMQNLATKELLKLKIDVQVSARVRSQTPTADDRIELTLSNGEKLITDLYVPTFGVTPNSSYVPSKYLNENGYIICEPELLKVKGAKDAYAAGDVSDVEWPQFITGDKQAAHLAKNFTQILSGKPQIPYKVATSRFMGVSIGKKAGTAHFGTYKVPSFIVVWARKNLFIDNAIPTVTGSLY
ncbi:hypothetical protein B0O99DRAFT_655527 [Bisporella sp. PMI_857]|nr:hypothetical protein B0O99DRAFT_655527 [Bisporella sp. PMI_857]